MASKQKQQGLTFIGLLVVGILLAFIGVRFAQFVPTYIEYMAVKKAVQKASTGTTVAEVRKLFDNAAQIDDISSVKGADLDISKQGDRVVVSFDYAREIHFLGPAYLVMKYSGSSQ